MHLFLFLLLFYIKYCIILDEVIDLYGYNIFHEKLMHTLLLSVREHRNANTYIFEGPSGLGKHDAALLFAKALVCNDTDHAPCCDCTACNEAQSGSHPDIIVMSSPKDKATIGVEPIRDMIMQSLVKPFYNRHKVFIINDGDALTTQAQNTFLKIIEEPPEYAVFIIVCTNALSLLETVRSRSVTITFPPVSDAEIKNYIATQYPSETRIDFLVRYSMGIPGYVDNIIVREDFETLREDVLNIIPRLLSKNKSHAFDVSSFIDEHKDNASEVYDMMMMYLRDAICYASGRPDKVINTDKTEKISILATRYDTRVLVRAIDELMLAKKMLDRYVKASATALHAALSIM